KNSYLTSLLFFFSSERRHTRSTRDWSSDVCSSDLDRLFRLLNHYRSAAGEDRAAWLDRVMAAAGETEADLTRWHGALLAAAWVRSEERRVGNECIYRCSAVR